jgi:hypothetical protein
MRSILSAVALLAFATPVFADRAMKCSFPDTGTSGFAVGEVMFHHASGDAEATLRSSVTEHFKAGEVKARVVKDDPKIFILSWKVDTKNSKNQYANIKYTLKVMKDGAKAQYVAQPLAYDNSWSNQGSCKPIKG